MNIGPRGEGDVLDFLDCVRGSVVEDLDGGGEQDSNEGRNEGLTAEVL